MTIETRVKDGATWRLGNASDVAWIEQVWADDGGVVAGLPPGYAAYCVIDLPQRPRPSGAQTRHDRAVVGLLVDRTAPQPWWLGYLDSTGNAEYVVFSDAAQVCLYDNWRCVFVLAGPQEALSWRPSEGPEAPYDGALPDIMYSVDRSWFFLTQWGEGWSCLGGSNALIEGVLADPELGMRAKPVVWGQPPPPQRKAND